MRCKMNCHPSTIRPVLQQSAFVHLLATKKVSRNVVAMKYHGYRIDFFYRQLQKTEEEK